MMNPFGPSPGHIQIRKIKKQNIKKNNITVIIIDFEF